MLQKHLAYVYWHRFPKLASSSGRAGHHILLVGDTPHLTGK
jgi:hypothetical protein